MATQVGERITKIRMQVELTEFDEAGEQCDQRGVEVAAIEAKIPRATRDWLLGLIPAKPKEG